MIDMRTIGVVATVLALTFPAAAQQQQGTGKAGDTPLCDTLYELYDLNMEAYYTKGQTNKQRQIAYNSAKRAISDFRKSGCKYNAS